MKVLLVEPMEHPKEIDIQPTLEEYYKVLDCDCITATYPWPEPVALVTDDNGLFTDKLFSRYIRELKQPIRGSFFLCGLGKEDFTDLPPELMDRFKNGSGIRNFSFRLRRDSPSSKPATAHSPNKENGPFCLGRRGWLVSWWGASDHREPFPSLLYISSGLQE